MEKKKGGFAPVVVLMHPYSMTIENLMTMKIIAL